MYIFRYKAFILLFITLLFKLSIAFDDNLLDELRFCENSNTYSQIFVHIGYWGGIRGHGNLIRLTLEISNVPYVEHTFGNFKSDGSYDFDSWTNHFKLLLAKVDTLTLPNLPFLVDCANSPDKKTRLKTETLPIMIYIAKTFNQSLIGESLNTVSSEKITEVSQMIYNSFLTLLQSFMYKSGSVESILNFHENFLSNTISSGPVLSMQNLEQLVKGNQNIYGGPFLFGNTVTIPDILIYEYTKTFSILAPGIVYDYSSIRLLVDSFDNIPIVQQYINSDRSVLYPLSPTENIPSQYMMTMNTKNEYTKELPRFGQFLSFYGYSLTTSTASVCLSYPIFKSAVRNVDNPSFYDHFGLLNFSQLADAALRIIGKNFLIRTYWRLTRRFQSTQKKIFNSCITVLTSGKYIDVSLSSTQAEIICIQFVNCFTKRSTAIDIGRSLINYPNKFKFIGGSTAVFNAERSFKNRILSPQLLDKAVRFYFLSKSMIKFGFYPTSSIVEVLKLAQRRGALTTFGILVNAPLAINICMEYSTNRLPFRNLILFKNNYNMQNLCESAFQPFILDDITTIVSDKSSTLVEVLEQISSSSEAIVCPMSLSKSYCTRTSSSIPQSAHPQSKQVKIGSMPMKRLNRKFQNGSRRLKRTLGNSSRKNRHSTNID
ncbi:uncharacterized protein CMU_038040 [Cryptosporidium muris RN66]|uniref:glutathione transferase n=1 Tax=Cryptosporidium muris (strain RN66) TaxID=441375 RepID=B6A948_CRYMR|nr:uncharacterized protein CMU_038040 [Cryptosporidium muris RN66]EEA04739.1 hypothetical protein, conserved [Cryptosporidium muris RN66]|eukprot:XP_002139088.1 hypothetical protein [Cryptosporidium muris RN66]